MSINLHCKLNKLMKTIKDILKADNYEQRRRIANNLAISREDKNALIVNQSNGGGGSGNNDITYYKVNLDNVPDGMYSSIRQMVYMFAVEIKAIHGESGYGYSNFTIAPAGYFIQPLDNLKPLAIGVQSYIKLITGSLDDNDNITNENNMVMEGTLKEVIDTLSELATLPFNFFDYLEPITKEEFYSLKN